MYLDYTMTNLKHISISLKIILLTITLSVSVSASSQIVERERPQEWNQLIPGARFIDRFLPMQGNVLSSDTWGANGVIPRYIDNGIEDQAYHPHHQNHPRKDTGRRRFQSANRYRYTILEIRRLHRSKLRTGLHGFNG